MKNKIYTAIISLFAFVIGFGMLHFGNYFSLKGHGKYDLTMAISIYFIAVSLSGLIFLIPLISMLRKRPLVHIWKVSLLSLICGICSWILDWVLLMVGSYPEIIGFMVLCPLLTYFVIFGMTSFLRKKVR